MIRSVPWLFGQIGLGELLLILAIVLLLSGARKLPEIARSLGRAVQEFKRGLEDSPPPQQAAPKDGEPGASEASGGEKKS